MISMSKLIWVIGILVLGLINIPIIKHLASDATSGQLSLATFIAFIGMGIFDLIGIIFCAWLAGHSGNQDS